MQVEGMLHAAILRSPHAHAIIKDIDIKKALKVPGVVAIYSFDDIANIAKPISIRMYSLPSLENYLQLPLAKEKVRYVGEPVAFVVADSRYVAEDVLDEILVTYEELPAVVDIRDALTDKVLVHEGPGTNLAAKFTVSKGDVDAVFRTADYTRKETFKVHRHTGNPLETRGLISTYDSDKQDLTVWGPTKVPHFNRGVLAKLLDFEEKNIHFIEPDVGGGFGIRGEFYPEDFLIPWASMQLCKPIKWIEDRREHLMAANHSRELLYDIEIAVNNDGKVLALKSGVYGNMGAYIRTHGALLPALGARFLTGPYSIPNYEYTNHCVITNKMGAGTYRAPGRYESCFVRERLFDMVSSDLKIDPVEFRRRNFVKPSEMPYEVGVTFPGNPPDELDSGDYESALNQALNAISYDKLRSIDGTLQDGKYHGVGIACYLKDTGRGPYEGARITVNTHGKVTIDLGITTMGQGHETSLAQICADGLNVLLDDIQVRHGSTDLISFGLGTFASRGGVMAGNAVYLAATGLKKKILRIAAKHLNLDLDGLDFENGSIVSKKSKREVLLSIDDVVAYGDDDIEPEDETTIDDAKSGFIPSKSAFNSTSARPLAEIIETEKRNPHKMQEPGISFTGFFESEHYVFPYGTHVAHVAVDAETGKIEIVDYVIVEDIGKAINPLICHGQAIGSCVQGIGGTILEELVYDDNGQLLTTTLMDHLLPISTDVPMIKSIILEESPSPHNPLGVKGAGEGGIVGTGSAIANAVSNALRCFEVQITQLPLSPNNIRELIRNSSSRS
jgi:carbon-monoxide dehydrogenase large subunit